tara:strand:+ start:6410 stop:6769 length:360 start_codon:yes stop_codon:yes gene_type:complete
MPKRLPNKPLPIDTQDEDYINAAASLKKALEEGGPAAVMDLLHDAGFTIAQIYRIGLMAHLKPGMEVNVTAPLFDDSPHSCAFSGTVERATETKVRVSNKDGIPFDLDFAEISLPRAEA